MWDYPPESRPMIRRLSRHYHAAVLLDSVKIFLAANSGNRMLYSPWIDELQSKWFSGVPRQVLFIDKLYAVESQGYNLYLPLLVSRSDVDCRSSWHQSEDQIFKLTGRRRA